MTTTDPEVPPRPIRPLPSLGRPNDFFWTSGKDGRLRIQRCGDCGFYVHPPAPVCRKCRSANVAPAVVSGRGTVFSFTVNHQNWVPKDDPAPYVVAVVELPEQEGLRLVTNIVRCEPGAVAIGMPVKVTFDVRGEIHVPLFEPD